MNGTRIVRKHLIILKAYLTKSPVLASPIKRKPLMLYITALEKSLGALLAHKNVEGRRMPYMTSAECW